MEPVSSDPSEKGTWKEFQGNSMEMYVVGERVDGGPLECIFEVFEDTPLQWAVPNLNWTVEKKEGRFVRLVAQPGAPAPRFAAADFFFKGKEEAARVFLFNSREGMRRYLRRSKCSDKFDHQRVTRARLQRVRASPTVRSFGSPPVELPDFMPGGMDGSGEPPRSRSDDTPDGTDGEPPRKRQHLGPSQGWF